MLQSLIFPNSLQAVQEYVLVWQYFSIFTTSNLEYVSRNQPNFQPSTILIKHKKYPEHGLGSYTALVNSIYVPPTFDICGVLLQVFL